jgi:C1A family cysteine protease
MPAKKRAKDPRARLAKAMDARVPEGGDSGMGGAWTRTVGTGWVPDLPDMRDFGLDLLSAKKKAETEHVVRLKTAMRAAPKKVQALGAPGDEPEGWNYDNLSWCPPVEDQEALGSCTAHSVVAMMEYMMLRASVRHFDLSRLFLYKTTRKLLGWTGDTGAYLRSTLQAAATFGVPPERYWDYDIELFEEEPEAFHYSFAAGFQALNYLRIDRAGTGRDARALLKRCIEAGLVAAFGFPVYSSMSSDGDVPFPTYADNLEGGHAVLAVGYDDDYPIGGDVGAIIFQNSWGEDWGFGGYGFIPYRYFDEELAVDIWTVLKQEWIDQSRFA